MAASTTQKQSPIDLIATLAPAALHDYVAAMVREINEAESGLIGAIANGDDDAAARHIHALKNSCSNVGNESLDQACNLLRQNNLAAGAANLSRTEVAQLIANLRSEISECCRRHSVSMPFS